MCGITGVYGWKDENKLQEMLSCINHRGPDESGSYMEDKDTELMMGMQRLSIVDLEGGSQPIYNEDGSICVVFNGEIYNYPKLRRDLESKGHNFSTDSDTEVLVHLWEEYGTETPEYLNGMFAFSLWDKNKEKLFLCRDRLGIKPLYYSKTEDGFIWGSEIPAILKAGVDRSLDEKSVYNYFSLHYTPWPDTMFKSIKKMEPGTSLLVSEEGVSKRKYWKLKPKKKAWEGSFKEASEKVRELLKESVERRLMADVPVGAFLSGGLDSSTVVGLMSEIRDDVKTFSVKFESESDESEEARFVADYFETDHHEIKVDLSSEDMFGNLIKHYGEPLPDPAVLPTMVLSKYTKKEVKVVQTGSGADELFGGYWMHRRIPQDRNRIKYIPKHVFKAIRTVSDYSPLAKNHVKYLGSLETDREAVLNAAKRFRPLETKKYMETELNDTKSGLYDKIDNAFSQAKDDTYHRVASFYLNYWLPDDILYKVDHSTMYASLEARVPFLDHNLVEFTYNLPSSYIIKKNEYKPLLKKAVSDLVPERTLERKKQGFGIQQATWLREDNKSISKWLEDEKIERTPYLNKKKVQSLWDSHKQGKEDYGITLWKIVNYIAWYHEFGIVK